MIAIKNWFLEKNQMTGLHGRDDLTVIKETEKAVLIDIPATFKHFKEWLPKSVIIEKWEKRTSGLAYHAYLENVYHEAYEAGQIENYTIKSGYNRYRGDAFIHQMTNKELSESLSRYKVDYMTYEAWKNREE